ncbi:ScbA/BarX family gamma-butyrolactone biosynthesis protein [Streptomyces venezuelae]|uniref:ScbA/BarX family gamma-butyrolactone biosynthesis protein n=1 Tax=Streptomyces venezuelae TaxID=54571 RepID=UPI00378BED08
MDRTLIHRHHLTEVFLTDIERTGEDTFVAAALLPAVHSHYTSQTAQAVLRHLDPMLLLECCRQAETAAAHLHHGVDRDTSFVLRNWSMELTGKVPGSLSQPAPLSTELVMTATTHDTRHRAGRLSGLGYTFTLWASGVRLGEVRMDVGYVAGAAYRVMRRRGRTGPPPSSDSPLPAARGAAVDPALVGRLHTKDTLLLDAVAGPAACTAALRVAADNPSLFDHPQDHVPGMVLVEAARQLAAFAVAQWDGPSPDRTVMVGMRAAFSAYAELDAPVTMTASRQRERGVEVTFAQNGAAISQVQIQLAPLPADGEFDERTDVAGTVATAPVRGR